MRNLLSMTTLSKILEHKIVAILRGVQPVNIAAVAEALYEGGVRCLEITLNSPGALQAIENISMKMEGRVLVGGAQGLAFRDGSLGRLLRPPES